MLNFLVIASNYSYIRVEGGGYKFSMKTKFKYNAANNVSTDPGGNLLSLLGKSDRHWQHMLLLNVTEQTEPRKQHLERDAGFARMQREQLTTVIQVQKHLGS